MGVGRYGCIPQSGTDPTKKWELQNACFDEFSGEGTLGDLSLPIFLACLKRACAKGCFLAFDVLWGEAPFVLSRFLGAFVLSPIEELLTQTPRRRKVLKAPSGKNTL